MRVWDLHPGYLGRGNLLGEHAEIHALHTILTEGRAGYARHPETLRWRGRIPALRLRHALTAAEMALRGMRHESPLAPSPRAVAARGPGSFVDAPGAQLLLLAEKNARRGAGRLPLPEGGARMWRQHELSALARGDEAHAATARIALGAEGPGELAESLALLFLTPPDPGGAGRALAALLGELGLPVPRGIAPRALFAAVWSDPALRILSESTLLSDLGAWWGIPEV